MNTPQQTFLLKDGVLLERRQTGLYHGWVPSAQYALAKGEPYSYWEGAKIPWTLWCEIVAFMRWSQATHKEEAMLTLFYNEGEKQWAAWPFAQEPAGMTVKYLTDHPTWASDRKQFGRGWVQMGSVHHHCTSGAFQSGVDKDDECNRDGLHITLGKMDQDLLDFDFRCVFEGVLTKCTNAAEWIELPPFVGEIPEWVPTTVFNPLYFYVDTEQFPQIWKERIFKKIVIATHNYHGGYVPHGQKNQATQTTLALVRRPETTPVSTVLTTKTSSTTTSNTGNAGSEAKGTEISCKRVNEYPGKDYMEKCENALLSIIEEYGHTVNTAYDWLVATPDDTWTHEMVTARSMLVMDLYNTGLPKLYAESLLSSMIDKGL